MSQGYFKAAEALTFATVTVQRSQFISVLTGSCLDDMHCDLMDVRLCDSAGLAFLLDAKRLCQKQNTKLLIKHASVDILALAKLYGIETILDNEEE
jgi:phospholipid transport system transporter-binding protein